MDIFLTFSIGPMHGAQGNLPYRIVGAVVEPFPFRRANATLTITERSGSVDFATTTSESGVSTQRSPIVAPFADTARSKYRLDRIHAGVIGPRNLCGDGQTANPALQH